MAFKTIFKYRVKFFGEVWIFLQIFPYLCVKNLEFLNFIYILFKVLAAVYCDPDERNKHVPGK